MFQINHFIRKIMQLGEKNNPFVKIQHGLIEFKVDAVNERVLKRAETFAIKEPETLEWLQKVIRAESVFWDIGANIGIYSLYAAMIAKDCKVLSFEAEAQNYANLCKNIWINNLDNIRPYVIGVSGESSDGSFIDLHLSDVSTGGAVHNLGDRSPWFAGNVVFRQPCYCSTVDNLVEKHALPSPTVLKIDVDGIETSILEGAKKILMKTVKTILLEIDSDNQNEVSKMTTILSGFGFTLSSSSRRIHKVNGMTPRNFIWEKQTI
jgi:FkbM family methyltransferase